MCWAIFLLDNGARINEVDYEGHTALMMSVIRQNSDAVKFLLERGAGASLRDKDGKTVLDFALEDKKFFDEFRRDVGCPFGVWSDMYIRCRNNAKILELLRAYSQK